jgi:excinuclease ABC subunit C
VLPNRIITGSEAEALLVESSLIKEKGPKYNISLRDDKSYPFLKVTIEEKFPRLFIGRGPQEPGIKAIGPYTNAALLKQAFRAIRQVIPFRTCRTLPQRACLDYYLKLCSAPCEGRVSPEAYRRNLEQIFLLMEGRKEQVVEELREKMSDASQKQQYEEAARYRDQISGLAELAARPRRFAPTEALADCASLLRLPKVPRRIEAFDISNIFGREAVGSCVTFLDGKPFKAGYQRFKIQTVAGIDDYAMMREVIRRHFLDLIEAKKGLPDLIVIDGGRGHLSAALEALKELSLELPALGIAKEFEEIFLPGQQEPVLLPPPSKVLQLIQRLRDEAHRFAIGYHRLLRGKRALRSALDEIPGVGPRRRHDLLIRFGSVEAIRKAAVEELAQVRGVSQMLAQRIHGKLKR